MKNDDHDTLRLLGFVLEHEEVSSLSWAYRLRSHEADLRIAWSLVERSFEVSVRSAGSDVSMYSEHMEDIAISDYAIRVTFRSRDTTADLSIVVSPTVTVRFGALVV